MQRDLPPRGGAPPVLEDDAVTLDSGALAGVADSSQTGPGGAPPAAHHPSQLRPGDTFAGRYQIRAYLGRGGFSYVYRASDGVSGEDVALKFLASREAGHDLVERMRRELRLARDLRHPNIVRVFELHEVDEFYCLAMECVTGRTLKEEIQARAPLAVEEARALLLQLASALAAVHAAGIVHRDLKPQNVIVTDTREVKLLDFGLARTPDSTGLTTTGTILGTPDYMAPEQVEGGKADSRSDVYSLGVMTYELLVGHPPFSGDSPLAVALQHVRARVPDPRQAREDVPDELARLVLAMTERDPARRPASAPEILVELTGQGSAVSARREESRRNRAWWLLRLSTAAALLAVVVGGAGTFIAGRRRALKDTGPLADGKVTVAVVTPELPSRPEARAFLSALASTLETRLVSPHVQIRRLDPEVAAGAGGGGPAYLALGVEELVRLKISDGGRAGGAVTVEALVNDTREVARWRPMANDELARLDLVGVDQEAGHLASVYLAAIDNAFAATQQGRSASHSPEQ